MDNEKLIWAGFALLTMVSFICLQGPFSSSHGSRTTPPGRADRTNSRRRHQTSSSVVPSERIGASSGSLMSRKGLTSNSRSDTKKGGTAPKHQGASPPPLKLNVNVSPIGTGVSHPSPHTSNFTASVITARHMARNAQSTNTCAAEVERVNGRSVVGRSTQTDSILWEEFCCFDALNSAPSVCDPLGCISPIISKDKDIASPISAEALYFNSPKRGNSKPIPLLPPSLEHGVEVELTKRVEAVQVPSAGAREWFDLYNFVTHVPRGVLRPIWMKKFVGLLLSPTFPPPVTVSDSSNGEVDPLWRLQEHVSRLLKDDSFRLPKNGQFCLSDEGTSVVWCAKEGKRLEKISRFSHICVFSSDEDEDERDDGDGDAGVVGRVEKVLLACRQASMHFAATQFPEESTLNAPEPTDQSQVAIRIPFEEQDVMTLLDNLVKLRNHASFDALRRSGIDISFSVGVVDVMNEAQRLLDRASIKMASVGQNTLQTLQTPPRSWLVSPAQRAVGQEPKWAQEEMPLTPLDGRRSERDTRMMPQSSLSPRHSRKSDIKRPALRDSATHDFGDFPYGPHDAPCLSSSAYENPASTPPRNGESHSFVRFLTASTIPSAALDENERQRTLYGRSRTQTVIELASNISSEKNTSNGTRSSNNVFSRLYTPPKNTQKAAAQPTPPLSGGKKVPFNVYV
ncbi:hypothetical protein TraAM80_04066 [Trypanosoma rangeli]|uniref:Transmembrane protein n=1 Tax=Trypanosoma rangeli TaxID=5698 RepID=A0A3R7NQQ1_TRYRA|nr:uncharacterized protein TraAM80_04066 [Trypanosoma rangeli]RNF06243.1 hypothetical protein TraAM80_04066 [Trypanosoma rangeli]|eukprot:RNF06243.1 hypothetical protein TraAM80_04066 [Trypanosoma rangeli]